MGKRSSFRRRPQDAYDTPAEAVGPLLPFLAAGTGYYEPCAGRGDLIATLKLAGHVCLGASDLVPRAPGIQATNFLDLSLSPRALMITNPPWSRPFLHDLLDRIVVDDLRAWLLFDSDWSHTLQSRRWLHALAAIVSVGRVKWIEGSASTGKDNCCWYLFDKRHGGRATRFVGPTTAQEREMFGQDRDSSALSQIRLDGSLTKAG